MYSTAGCYRLINIGGMVRTVGTGSEWPTYPHLASLLRTGPVFAFSDGPRGRDFLPSIIYEVRLSESTYREYLLGRVCRSVRPFAAAVADKDVRDMTPGIEMKIRLGRS